MLRTLRRRATFEALLGAAMASCVIDLGFLSLAWEAAGTPYLAAALAGLSIAFAATLALVWATVAFFAKAVSGERSACAAPGVGAMATC